MKKLSWESWKDEKVEKLKEFSKIRRSAFEFSKTILRDQTLLWHNTRTTPAKSSPPTLYFVSSLYDSNRSFQRKPHEYFSEIIVAHDGVWCLFLSISVKSSLCRRMSKTGVLAMGTKNSMIIFPWDRCEIYKQALDEHENFILKFSRTFFSVLLAERFSFGENIFLSILIFSRLLSYSIFWDGRAGNIWCWLIVFSSQGSELRRAVEDDSDGDVEGKMLSALTVSRNFRL